LLPNNLPRTLVFPETEKYRLAQSFIPDPLREFYLANQLWLYPVASLEIGGRQALVPPTTAGSRYVEKGATLHLKLAQVRVLGSQKLLAESGSDSAAEFNLLAFIESYKQRAEMFSGPIWIGVSAATFPPVGWLVLINGEGVFFVQVVRTSVCVVNPNANPSCRR
jgi:hypothetical protein